MSNKPDDATLLNLARRVLHDDLLADLPEAARYRARMVGNAMAIAARAITDGGHTREAERKALAALYDEAPGSTGRVDAEPLDDAVTRLNWWLTAEIRAGRRDGDAQAHALLVECARARLRLVNPKTLRGRKEQGDVHRTNPVNPKG